MGDFGFTNAVNIHSEDKGLKKGLNSFIPKKLLAVLLTVCHIILVMLL